ncbi:rhombosortase [Variovorax terrae]|uniref:Rhombosortase n=1 Tax=Variovorax terrae TaxID=2923278 RepID=A0A9X1VYI3_9BURK|nr:rhombosortase [Variovorax terrae]MCJ0765822.1 rhombosortase [Variovorax terrae]
MKAWPALCLALAVASLAVWLAGGPVTSAAHPLAPLVWDAARWPHQPWTLWTASLVHLSGGHLLANLLALGALAVLGCALRAGRAATLALLLAWPLGTLSLLLWPQITRYSGLSGLIHAMVGVLWASVAIKSGAKSWTVLLFAGLFLKLASEHAWSNPIGFSPEWGFNVVYAAHLGGALAGTLCGLLAGGLAQWRQSQPAAGA